MNTWKYVKNNVTNEEIAEIETLSGFSFSGDLKKIFLEYNNGRPEKKLFDTDKTKGRVFDKLLSVREEDAENVFKVYFSLKGQLPEDMLALAADPFGNYLCVNKCQKVFLWLHETSDLEATGKKMVELIDSLY